MGFNKKAELNSNAFDAFGPRTLFYEAFFLRSIVTMNDTDLPRQKERLDVAINILIAACAVAMLTLVLVFPNF